MANTAAAIRSRPSCTAASQPGDPLQPSATGAGQGHCAGARCLSDGDRRRRQTTGGTAAQRSGEWQGMPQTPSTLRQARTHGYPDQYPEQRTDA